MGRRENGVIYSALRKYKPENFIVKTLVIANKWDYLCDLEKKAIIAFGTKYPHGYNMTDGGEGIIGRQITDETRARMSESQKKRFSVEIERNRLREQSKKAALTRKELFESRRINGRAPWEHRNYEKRSRSGSVEHREKISAGVKAAMATPEMKKAMKHFAAERAANPEWRKKIGDSKRGKLYGKRSEEFVEKQVAGIKAAWADPVKKAQRILKNAEARKKTNPGVDLTCGNCGKIFHVPKWVAESKSPKNCSRACYFESKKKFKDDDVQIPLIPAED